MKVIAIIPARFNSSRFPGKPLAKLGNKYIIQHVYEQAIKSCLFADVIVGTDDQRIFEAVNSFNGKVVLTSKKHKSGTDRVAEVCDKILSCKDADIVINIQGDEPFINEVPLRKLIEEFYDKTVQVASLMHKLDSDAKNPNVVKVICDKQNNALSFSRIPFTEPKTPNYKHIGVYAFRRQILFEFVKLPESTLEKIEKLEQLRLIENGYKIRMVLTSYKGLGIDTPEDLKNAEQLM